MQIGQILAGRILQEKMRRQKRPVRMDGTAALRNLEKFKTFQVLGSSGNCSAGRIAIDERAIGEQSGEAKIT